MSIEASNLRNAVLLYSSRVPCGFPSPAEDYIETPLDLNELIITKPAATIFIRASGDSMEGIGIFDGDIIAIDRSKTPDNNQIVLAHLDGGFTLKRYVVRQQKIFLVPENKKYSPIEITEEMDFRVWGVATYNIHKFP